MRRKTGLALLVALLVVLAILFIVFLTPLFEQPPVIVRNEIPIKAKFEPTLYSTSPPLAGVRVTVENGNIYLLKIHEETFNVVKNGTKIAYVIFDEMNVPAFTNISRISPVYPLPAAFEQNYTESDMNYIRIIGDIIYDKIYLDGRKVTLEKSLDIPLIETMVYL